MYVMALDPAQLRDWSAIAVVKMKLVKMEKRSRFEYDLVAMNRHQGLPYDHPTLPSITSWAFETYRMQQFRTNGQPPEFVLDATGVGIAVRDMLLARGIRLKAVTITPGEAFTRVGSLYHLAKSRLIGTFLGAYDAGKVHINPNMPIWPLLREEMIAFRAAMSSQGRAKFEAEPGEHDDMLFALALCTWFGEEIKRGKRL